MFVVFEIGYFGQMYYYQFFFQFDCFVEFVGIGFGDLYEVFVIVYFDCVDGVFGDVICFVDFGQQLVCFGLV